MEVKKIQGEILSGNALKILGALSMLADHVGLMFFPEVTALRIVGRLAYPIFAYMIAEGCAHTRNRRRYFLRIHFRRLGRTDRIRNHHNRQHHQRDQRKSEQR